MTQKTHAVIIKLVFLLLVVLPITAGLLYALGYSLGVFGLLSKGLTTTYWEKALTSYDIWISFLYSFCIGLASVIISFFIALGMALGWSKSIQKGRLSYFIYMPLCFPATVMAFLVLQWFSASGFFSRIAFQLGIIDKLENFPVMVHDFYGIGIILCSVFLITPFFTILVSNIYKNESLSYLENLSKTLGANRHQRLFRVTLPVIYQKSKVTLLLFVIFVMGSFEVPLLLGRQYPQMVTVAIVNKIQKFNLNDIPIGFAMSIIYVILVVTLLRVFGKSKTIHLNQNLSR